MDPQRVKAIQDWKKTPLRTYRDIQVFLGFCNFYCRFVYGFSIIAQPLHDLLKGMKAGRKPGNITATEWQEPQRQAYEQLIDSFTTAPVLRHYDPYRRLQLETDALGRGLAGILSQEFEESDRRKNWHPIAFFSRKFSSAEKNYDTHDREMLSIVASFQHWRHYLEGAKRTEVITDHDNLKKFISQTTLNGRQARWLIQLIPYDFEISFRKGINNPADTPSRYGFGDANDDDNNMPLLDLIPALRAKVKVWSNDHGNSGH